MTWQNGRQLASINSADLSASYSYGLDGIRTAKTVNGITTEYYWQNGILQGQRTGNDSILFLYNASGAAYGMICKTGETESTYYYLFNAQGDVITLLDSTGNCVAEYAYDEWGKLLTITGSQADTTGLLNPIRYRGYYYDSETGFYYLQSRYYDPEIGRFINADAYISTGTGLIGFNMYAYCDNNPINHYDSSGYCKINYAYKTGKIDCNNPMCLTSSSCILNRSIGSGLKFAKLPPTGDPNSKSTLYNPDGTPKQERWYDEHGKPSRDRDYNHPGNMEFPHDHEWSNGNRSEDHLPVDPSFKSEIGVGIAAGALAVGAGYLVYRGVRMIPSLFPPLWWTIPVNVAVP